jgi:hypothetical protein
MLKRIILGVTLLALLCIGACSKKTDRSQTRYTVGETIDLLAPDMSNCSYSEQGWKYEDGVLTWLESKGDVWTQDQYGDFVLELDWRIVKECNSGIIIRCTDPNDWMYTGFEVQIHENGDGAAHGQCGAVYSLVSPVYYENGKVVITKGDQTWRIPAVRGHTEVLPTGTKVKIQKVFTNLKMVEYKGKMRASNAASVGQDIPAVMVQVSSDQDDPVEALVYPDKTKNAPMQDYQFSYQLAGWVPEKDVRKPVGEWNHMKVSAQGPRIQVELNGAEIVDIDLDQYTTARKNPQGTFNKYQIPVKDMGRRGYLALQDHGHAVWFKNIKITPLN